MLEQVDVRTLQENVFTMMDQRWMLITAGTREVLNTMTASWGGLGVLWNKDVATIYLRPSRYTCEFTERQDYFSLCFFPEEYREKLTYCGTKSGRDIDKVKECSFTVEAGIGDTPYFTQAQLVLICKKLYATQIDPQSILDKEVFQQHYTGEGQEENYHRVYVGEIVEALRQSV